MIFFNRIFIIYVILIKYLFMDIPIILILKPCNITLVMQKSIIIQKTAEVL